MAAVSALTCSRQAMFVTATECPPPARRWSSSAEGGSGMSMSSLLNSLRVATLYGRGASREQDGDRWWSLTKGTCLMQLGCSSCEDLRHRITSDEETSYSLPLKLQTQMLYRRFFSTGCKAQAHVSSFY
ncbi:uncharacterized protein [Triticum aestivum]|uniref:uncharacterized protein n=1 Tax=Triticum aestivum TaxID=4565 RepID=UPI001D0186B6|nr:uncharacterized protein LOC123132048 [Triticum aestivum]